MFITNSSEATVPGMSLDEVKLYLAADGLGAAHAEEFVRMHGIEVTATGGDEIIPLTACWRIFMEHAAVMNDEMHGVTASQQKSGMTNLIIARMMVCENLHEALQAYSEAVSLVVPDLEVSLVRRGDEVALRWHLTGLEYPLCGIVLEGLAIVYYAIFCWLVDSKIDVLRVRAPECRRGCASTQLNFLNAAIGYAGGDMTIVLPSDALEQKIVNKDVAKWQDGVYEILYNAVHCEHEAELTGQFTIQVRAALMEGLGQKQIAAAWGISTKTIARRLAQEGSSFRQLRNEIRMERAASLIHAGLSVEEIAYMVGYEDPRSFRRAFARWFGQSPSRYRAARQNGPEVGDAMLSVAGC